ncbi:hypothetical protein MRX96_009028 [Rhipicephalus microplus]
MWTALEFSAWETTCDVSLARPNPAAKDCLPRSGVADMTPRLGRSPAAQTTPELRLQCAIRLGFCCRACVDDSGDGSALFGGGSRPPPRQRHRRHAEMCLARAPDACKEARSLHYSQPCEATRLPLAGEWLSAETAARQSGHFSLQDEESGFFYTMGSSAPEPLTFGIDEGTWARLARGGPFVEDHVSNTLDPSSNNSRSALRDTTPFRRICVLLERAQAPHLRCH